MSGLSIRTNLPVLKAQRSLAQSTQYLQQGFERLASGRRINKASDDAAGLAIADRLRADSRISTTAIRNANDGFSALTIMSSTLGNQTSILTRMLELAEQSANGTFSSAQRGSLNAEYQALIKEFGRLGDTTNFNGLSLLSNGSNPLDITLQVGIRGNAGSRLSFSGISSGSFSGTIDFESLKGDALMDSMSLATLTDYYGGNLSFATITDNSGVKRDVLIAVTAGTSVSGALSPVFQIYQRVSDTGTAGATTAAGAKGQVLSNSHEWVLGQQVTAGAIQGNGHVPNFITANLTFIGGRTGSSSLDVRQLQFSSGFLDYARIYDAIVSAIIEKNGGVPSDYSPEDSEVDLGFDSLDVNEVSMDIEEELAIDIPDEWPGYMFTIGNAARYIYSLNNTIPNGTQTAIDFTNILTVDQSRNALTVVQNRLTNIGVQQGMLGATQSRLESSLSLLNVSREAILQAEARIRDVDVAAETARLTAAQILQQSASEVLANAKNQPQLALTLLSNI